MNVCLLNLCFKLETQKKQKPRKNARDLFFITILLLLKLSFLVASEMQSCHRIYVRMCICYLVPLHIERMNSFNSLPYSNCCCHLKKKKRKIYVLWYADCII